MSIRLSEARRVGADAQAAIRASRRVSFFTCWVNFAFLVRLADLKNVVDRRVAAVNIVKKSLY